MRKLILGCAALLFASTASAQSRTVVSTTGNSATLSAAIRVGDMLYLSGQLPGTREAPMDSTIQGQTKQALDKIKGIVEAAGTKMENVVKCTVFLVSGADFQGMNQAYSAAGASLYAYHRPRQVVVSVDGDRRTIFTRAGAVQPVHDRSGTVVAQLKTTMFGHQLLNLREGAQVSVQT